MLTGIIAFVVGVGIGALGGWTVCKRRYLELAANVYHEHVSEVKEKIADYKAKVKAVKDVLEG